jgi:hypothetical protein
MRRGKADFPYYYSPLLLLLLRGRERILCKQVLAACAKLNLVLHQNLLAVVDFSGCWVPGDTEEKTLDIGGNKKGGGGGMVLGHIIFLKSLSKSIVLPCYCPKNSE